MAVIVSLALGSSGLLLGATTAGAATHAGSAAPSAHPTPTYRAVCPPKAGTFTCRALVRTNVHGPRPDGLPQGFGPQDLESAYQLPVAKGAGMTVAITGQGGYSKAESDLATYRSTYGLPACTIASGCLTLVNEEGKTSPLPPDNQNWWGESGLDMDMVSAACPQCKILYVESNTSEGNTGLLKSINTAVSLGATIVTNSWGDYSSTPWLDKDYKQYFDHKGVVILFASGDIGYGAAEPDSKLLVMVGSTSLRASKNARGWSESVWDGSTSWCSTANKTASWMPKVGCKGRLMVDLATDGDPNTGPAVYINGRWGVEGGTSASSPFVAGIYGLGAHSAKITASKSLYAHPKAFYDVTSGSDGSCSPAIFCTAGPGFDGASGLGTPDGIAAFR
jgi:hypothetical protein